MSGCGCGGNLTFFGWVCVMCVWVLVSAVPRHSWPGFVACDVVWVSPFVVLWGLSVGVSRPSWLRYAATMCGLGDTSQPVTEGPVRCGGSSAILVEGLVAVRRCPSRGVAAVCGWGIGACSCRDSVGAVLCLPWMRAGIACGRGGRLPCVVVGLVGFASRPCRLGPIAGCAGEGVLWV